MLQRNQYERQTLYNEVWEEPVTTVAKKYGVSDVAIHKICKSLNIPVPPRGYWAKLRAGKSVKKTPLPKTKGATIFYGNQSFNPETLINEEIEPLSFMTAEERAKVLNVCDTIRVDETVSNLHKKVVLQKRKVREWNKEHPMGKGQQIPHRSYYWKERPPVMGECISNDGLIRAGRILNTLYRALENLDCTILEDMQILVKKDTVRIYISEMQTKRPHVNTKQEESALRKYEIESKRSYWASQPQIRKWDYFFDGRLRFEVDGYKTYRDRLKNRIEDKLDEIIIGIFEKAEAIRIERVKREEEQLKREEEQRRRELLEKRTKEEKVKTAALLNMAADWHKANQIREYIKFIELNNSDKEEMKEWIKWAYEKADWLDPMVARNDPLLGIRNHTQVTDEGFIELTEKDSSTK